MITLLEYLAYLDEGKYDYKKDQLIYPHLEEIQEYNKALVTKYPFLLPRNVWTDEVLSEYDFTWTELDAMPEGWRIRFGEEMVEEISQELRKFDYEDKYRILQIKEKWGELRWYDGGVPIGKLSDPDIELFIKDWSNRPHSDYEIDYWEYETEDDGYRFQHRTIIDRCKIHDIIEKYTKLSKKICIRCGDLATYRSCGWISPWCQNCKEEIDHHELFRELTVEDYLK